MAGGSGGLSQQIETHYAFPVGAHDSTALAIGAILFLSLTSGTLLYHYSSAQLPFLDSFTTWGSILTTWMVTRKILENWLYWIVIDGVSIFLYLDRGLYLTALLFMVYLVIVVFGYRQWLQNYRTV